MLKSQEKKMVSIHCDFIRINSVSKLLKYCEQSKMMQCSKGTNIIARINEHRSSSPTSDAIIACSSEGLNYLKKDKNNDNL